MWTWHEEQCENMVKTGKFECPVFYRASGDILCATCGRTYYDHPVNIPYHFLTMLCNGECVKL